MATPSPVRYLRHELVVYRRTWRSSLVPTFLAPILYLAAIGGTLGSAIDRHTGHLGGVSYVVWLAPGLMAASAMQVAVNDCTHPVLGGFKWTRHFVAAAATPLRPVDLVSGWLLWMSLRLALAASVFAAVIWAAGDAVSPWLVAAVPAAALTGLAFAGPITAWSATRQGDESFSTLQRFVILPLFLFSGVFFPVTQLPAVLRPVAFALPLWHGVALCRSLALGTAGPAATMAHVAVLAAFAVVGTVVAAAMFRARLGA